MGIKKFIKELKEYFYIEDPLKKSKKKSLNELLDSLASRRDKLEKKLSKNLSKKKRNEIEEENEIITLQIKKGYKILKKLNSK